jgi:hypothetical protein
VGKNLEGRLELQWLDLEGREARNCGGENIQRQEMRWLDRTWDFGTKQPTETSAGVRQPWWGGSFAAARKQYERGGDCEKEGEK